MKITLSFILSFIFLSPFTAFATDNLEEGEYKIGITQPMFAQGGVSIYFQNIETQKGKLYGGYIWAYNQNPYPVHVTMYFTNPENAVANLITTPVHLAKKGDHGFIQYMGTIIKPNINADWHGESSLTVLAVDIPRNSSGGGSN